MVKFVLFSDTHGHYVDLPEGDVLIYAGDWSSSRGSIAETNEFARWMGSQHHPHKIAIPGNHDFPADTHPDLVRKLFEERGVVYLIDEGVSVRVDDSDLINIYGTPWHPKIWGKFELEREDLHVIWELVPERTDVLVTHGPPHGILDKTDERHGDTNAGDQSLNKFYLNHRLGKTRAPFLHVFGHIHEGYGQSRIGNTRFVNASVCDVDYNPVNEPFVWSY